MFRIRLHESIKRLFGLLIIFFDETRSPHTNKKNHSVEEIHILSARDGLAPR